jgi:hypothetical protein
MIESSQIDRLRAGFNAELDAVSSDRDLQDLRNRYLGRKRGTVAILLKQQK